MQRPLTAFAFVLLAVSAALADAPKPHVVMLIAEREYQTDQSLPAFAKEHLADRYRTTIVSADPDDKNKLVGIEAVEHADVLLVSVRRRTLPATQLNIIRRYVAAGKPVIGIRTANHAFSLRGKEAPEGRAVWPQWDQHVFGGNYTNHYGNDLPATITIAASSPETKSLLADIEPAPFVAGGSLYRVAPLADATVVCMTGRVDGHDPEPVAWTFRRQDGGWSFYTSLGHVDDFKGNVLPTLLRNAIATATH